MYVKSKPTVSIIMPAYNAEHTIKLAIDSVLAQTYNDFEVIIVNDASTDKTHACVEAYADSRLILIKTETNRGVGGARDLAISHANGEWLAFIDADDAWHPERLEKLLTLIPTDTRNCMVTDNIMQCYECNGELKAWRPLWAEDTIPRNFTDFLALPSHMIQPIFPRHIVDEICLCHSDYQFGEDAQFLIKAVKLAGLEFIVTSEALYYYRLTPRSLSTNNQKYIIKRDILYELLSELKFSNDEQNAIGKALFALERQISYEPFLNALRQRKYLTALKMVLAKPVLIAYLLEKLPKTLHYRIHIMRVGGISR
jgi:succinoglycan biosynthesis protein ExoO